MWPTFEYHSNVLKYFFLFVDKKEKKATLERPEYLNVLQIKKLN